MAQFKRRADAFSLPRRVSIVVVVSAAFLFLFRGADRLKGRHGLPVRRVDFLFAGRRASFFFSPCLWCTSSTQRGGNVGKKKKRGPTLACAPFGSDPQKNCRGSRVPPIFSEGARPWVALDQKKFFCPCRTHDIAPPRCSLHFFTFAFLSGSLDNTSSPFLRMYAKETEKKKEALGVSNLRRAFWSFLPTRGAIGCPPPPCIFFFDCPTLHFSPTVTLFLSPVWKKGVQQNVCDEGEKRIAFPFFYNSSCTRACLSLCFFVTKTSHLARARVKI